MSLWYTNISDSNKIGSHCFISCTLMHHLPLAVHLAPPPPSPRFSLFPSPVLCPSPIPKILTMSIPCTLPLPVQHTESLSRAPLPPSCLPSPTPRFSPFPSPVLCRPPRPAHLSSLSRAPLPPPPPPPPGSHHFHLLYFAGLPVQHT